MNSSDSITQLQTLAKSCRRGELMTVQLTMSRLHELLSGVIKDGEQWLACLTRIETAYKSSDYLYLADMIDYQLIPQIQEVVVNDR